MGEDWCEVEPMVLPPPPCEDVNIAHYETAMNLGSMPSSLTLKDSFKLLMPKIPSIRWMYNTSASKEDHRDKNLYGRL